MYYKYILILLILVHTRKYILFITLGSHLVVPCILEGDLFIIKIYCLKLQLKPDWSRSDVSYKFNTPNT